MEFRLSIEFRLRLGCDKGQLGKGKVMQSSSKAWARGGYIFCSKLQNDDKKTQKLIFTGACVIKKNRERIGFNGRAGVLGG